MQARPRISPVLVGRDDLLALGERRAAAAREGDGHLLFLAGEAGIGKTRLLGATVRAAERAGLRHAAGAAFPRDLELAGAVLLDLADQLTRSDQPAWADAGRSLLDRLSGAETDAAGDRHRQRRLLVLDLADLIVGLAEAGPAVVTLEDLHWADDLTLAVVAQVARRLRDSAMLVVGTYRSDELYPRLPMRDWRARLLGQRLAEEVRLARLDLDGTAAMATLLLARGLPAPRRLVEDLHRRSDGIPLHVEELLGALDERQPNDLGAIVLPDTLADAVLERAAQLSPTARRVASSAAVIGRSFDLALISEVDGSSSDRVGRALAELAHRFFVVETPEGWFDFRHALIRDALESALDPERRRFLHGRVAGAADRRPDVASHAFLSEDGFAASAAVDDAAYLFPYLVTGTRARLAIGDPEGAGQWVRRVGEAIERRSIPGTLSALDHARGILLLAEGSTGKARDALEAARSGWTEADRWWEATWCGLDLARCLIRSNRQDEAERLAAEVTATARDRGAAPLMHAAAEVAARTGGRRLGGEAWAPLTAREFAVARLIADGRTNREIADELSIAPKTVAAHVEHILARLGASRRAEIAAWVADRRLG